jgi:ADP-ribose pyrophosphatase YjhB (NUDIX family)
MSKAARAIIIENNKILLMHRNKYGNKYFTLIGGRAAEGEPLEQTLVREVKEETGLDIVQYRLVYYEDHEPPYNEQYIYLCEVAPHDKVALEEDSEEAQMNKYELTTHHPMWVDLDNFENVPFNTIQLQQAIIEALKNDFPKEPVTL